MERERLLGWKKVTVENLYDHIKLHCGEDIDSNYWNNFTGTKGVRTVTGKFCSDWYLKKSIVDTVELMRHPEVSENNPLTLCNFFKYEYSVSNMKYKGNIWLKQEKKRSGNKRHLETLVVTGNQKYHRRIWIWCWGIITILWTICKYDLHIMINAIFCILTSSLLLALTTTKRF